MTRPNRRKCCCCIIASDTFDTRATELEQPPWKIVEGGWSVEEYKVSSSSGGKVFLEIPHPENSHSMVVYYDIIEDSTQYLKHQDYWIMLGVENDNKYYLAKYIQRSELTSKIQLLSVSGGTPTLLKEQVITSVTPALSRRFTAMIADEEFCAEISSAVFSKVTYDPNLAGKSPAPYKCGFGGEFTEKAWIDNFVFSRHAQTKEYCPYCICSCEGFYIPDTLYAHITGIDPRMDELDCTMRLEWDRTEGRWEGHWIDTYESGNCSCGNFQLDLSCDPEARSNSFSLFIRTTCYTGTTPLELISLPESQCNPFYLVFERIFVPETQLTCNCGAIFAESGSWFIEITDRP
jgi:hypothetical protein